jgi:methyl-accepting chemotaxis protein
LGDFAEEYSEVVKGIAKELNYTDSVYIYFNSEVFNQAYDIWFSKSGQGTFERQDQFPLSYYDGDVAGKDWFYGPVRSKISKWTAPYISENGDLITSYVRPVVKNGKVIAVAGMDLNLARLQADLGEQVLYETGYLYMLDQDYNFIVHPDVEMGKNLSEFEGGQQAIDAMSKEQTGYAVVEKDGVSRITGFDHMSNGWVIASSIPIKEVTGVVDAIVMLVLIIAIVSIVASIVVAFVIGKSISKPILQVTETINKVKDGDFTAEVRVNSQDETKILADGVNEMIHTVRSLIANAKGVSSEMADAATNLASMAEETSATSDEVARTVHEIAEGATDQAQEAESGTRKAGDLDQMFKTLIENSETMANNAETAMSVSKEGGESLSELKNKSEVSKKSNMEVSAAIATLDEKANAISSIIDTITSIAEQTNLLALNASIEAARAGEAGRGFAVVADEIRKLAEDSSSAASQIQNIVIDIQNESRETVNIMRGVETISQEQNEAVDNVSGSIDKVFEAIENITSQIENVTNQVMQLNSAKDDIVSSISNISAVSQETAAATEEVTASMEQQNMAVEEVAKSAESLNELSIELSQQINQFKI